MSAARVLPAVRDKPNRPFRCLDPQYRRELVRVYLTNVETICRRFCEEKRAKLAWLRDNAEQFRQFWDRQKPESQRKLIIDKADAILKVHNAAWRRPLVEPLRIILKAKFHKIHSTWITTAFMS